jgi:hypothetical protein
MNQALRIKIRKSTSLLNETIKELALVAPKETTEEAGLMCQKKNI